MQNKFGEALAICVVLSEQGTSPRNTNTETIMATDSVREDDTLEFSLPEMPAVRTVPTGGGEVRELTPYEQRRVDESAADTEMRRQAAAAPKMIPGEPSVLDQYRSNVRREPRPVDPNTIYGFDLSPSIHPERILSLVPDEHDDVRGYLKDATEFFANTHSVLERIDNAYRVSMTDTTITPDARSARLEKETTAAHDRAFAARGAAIESLQKKISHTEGELNRPLEAAAATPRSNELRQVLRTLTTAKINEAIRAALTAEQRTPQQTELLNATLGAHALTVGISELDQAMHIRAYNEKTQPQVLRRLEIMRKALTVVQSVKPELLRSQFEGSMRSPFSRASAIRGVSESAASALAKINNPGAAS
jgi:hypothetical protein